MWSKGNRCVSLSVEVIRQKKFDQLTRRYALPGSRSLFLGQWRFGTPYAICSSVSAVQWRSPKRWRRGCGEGMRKTITYKPQWFQKVSAKQKRTQKKKEGGKKKQGLQNVWRKAKKSIPLGEGKKQKPKGGPLDFFGFFFERKSNQTLQFEKWATPQESKFRSK